MLRDTILLPIAVALLLTVAGCTGATAPTAAPSANGGAAQPPATGAVQSVPGGSQGSFAGYTELYDRTIDSVVEVVVRTPRGRSQGSGFVYDDAGYIVTNQHVVDGAERVQVRFQSGAWQMADVVGTDVYTDLAVVKVQSLPPGVDSLPLATHEPEQGQPVVALGSPLGYEGTITTGVVSGVNRSMPTGQGFSIPDTIQTDAAINPGNSGGPLVSTTGAVVGVNRAKQGDNLGFAISADVVRRVVPDLIDDGTYRHPYMGIEAVPVTPVIAEANGLSEVRGVMVVRTVRGGPAAGELRPAVFRRTESGTTIPVDGDVVVAIDGTRIRSPQDLAQYLMLQTSPGEEVTVTVVRDGARRTETITLGRRPELDVGSGGTSRVPGSYSGDERSTPGLPGPAYEV